MCEQSSGAVLVVNRNMCTFSTFGIVDEIARKTLAIIFLCLTSLQPIQCDVSPYTLLEIVVTNCKYLRRLARNDYLQVAQSSTVLASGPAYLAECF